MSDTTTHDSDGFKKLVKLRPCSVCEAPSTGYHFGVMSCEACKVRYFNLLQYSPSDLTMILKSICVTLNIEAPSFRVGIVVKKQTICSCYSCCYLQ